MFYDSSVQRIAVSSPSSQNVRIDSKPHTVAPGNIKQTNRIKSIPRQLEEMSKAFDSIPFLEFRCFRFLFNAEIMCSCKLTHSQFILYYNYTLFLQAKVNLS